MEPADALFEHGGIPRHVQVEHDRGVLQIQADAAGVGRQERPAARVVAKAVDQVLALAARNAPVEQDVIPATLLETAHQEFVHAQPLTEDNDLGLRPLKNLRQQRDDLFGLGTMIVRVIDEVAVVAGHAHAQQGDQSAGVCRLPRDSDSAAISARSRDNFPVLSVMFQLVIGHGHEDVRVDAFGQLVEHHVLLPAHQDRLEGLADLIQVLVADHLADVVVDLMIVQQLEGGAEPIAVDELHDGDQLFQAILQRRSREHDGIGGSDALDAAGHARVPVLDALGLVENDQVGVPGLDKIEIAMDGVVVHDLEEGIGAEADLALCPQTANDLNRALHRTFDLALPLVLEGGGADNEHPFDAEQPGHDFAGGNGLNGFAKPHFVADETAAGFGGEQGPFPLIIVERHARRGP